MTDPSAPAFSARHLAVNGFADEGDGVFVGLGKLADKGLRPLRKFDQQALRPELRATHIGYSLLTVCRERTRYPLSTQRRAPMATYKKVSAFKQAARFDTFQHACAAAGQWERRNHEDFIRFHIQHDDDAWIVSLDHVGFSPSFLGA